ncbi:MAG: hypothetical protein VYE40_19985 [Myxococcota bacterium]|nr:hypothetical protein [Myxococcota bacterium]
MSGNRGAGERKSLDHDLFARAVARVRARVFDTIDVLERFDVLVEQSSERASRYDIGQLASYLDAPPTMPGQHMRLIAMLAVHDERDRALEVLHSWGPSLEDRELAVFRGLALAHMMREDVRPEVISERALRDAA